MEPNVSSERILSSDIFAGEKVTRERIDLGTLREAARDIPIHAQCDVLVVGGGATGLGVASGRQNYWGGAPRVDELLYQYFDTDEAAVNALTTGSANHRYTNPQ